MNYKRVLIKGVMTDKHVLLSQVAKTLPVSPERAKKSMFFFWLFSGDESTRVGNVITV